MVKSILTRAVYASSNKLLYFSNLKRCSFQKCDEKLKSTGNRFFSRWMYIQRHS